jgi:cytochrome c
MLSRAIPSSVKWLAVLLLLAIGAASVGGAILYLQAREAKKTQAEAITLGNVTRGEAAIARYGCAACHVIPGIADAQGQVGPDLSKISQRAAIAGKLGNDPETMVRWLMHPQALVPGTGMPEQGVTQRDARDIAAYLYAES